MAPMEITIGVDPGPVNTGWCIRSNDNFVLAQGTFNPSQYGDIIMAAQLLFSRMLSHVPSDTLIRRAAIERFVSYDGVMTTNAEATTLFIGSLTFLLRSHGITTYLVRAISWKPAVAKDLHLNRGFNNPSEKLDKKFSKAAALAITEVKSQNDHEADAVCLSHFAYITTKEAYKYDCRFDKPKPSTKKRKTDS